MTVAAGDPRSDTFAFLSKILPSRGHYFVATLVQGSSGKKFFRHHLAESPAHAAMLARSLDEGGGEVYFACASFREPFVMVDVPDPKTGEIKKKKRERIQENVLLCRSFWIDLDVEAGNETKYQSQEEALHGLASFIQATGLPWPMIVSSGYGIHVYWALAREANAPQWLTTARMLKTLATTVGLKQDPSRTADPASVLRPIGTHNRKKATPAPVTLEYEGAGAIEFEQFHVLLEQACRDNDAEVRQDAKIPDDPNARFMIQQDFPESHADLIADRCQQIGQMRDTAGCIPEPQWYGAIQVLNHTVEADDVIHRWSSGYKGYSHGETEQKRQQVRGFGPTTCATFAERNPEGCKGCPFRGKITSPIQLGQKAPESLPAPKITIAPTVEGAPAAVVEIPNPPAPFTRGQDGLYVQLDTGVPKKFYDYDLYVSSRGHDEHAGHEMATIVHCTPKDGVKVFSFPPHLLESERDACMHLRKNGVMPRDRKLMVAYLMAYLEQLQKSVALTNLYNSMGWKEDNTAFVLGRRTIYRDRIVDAPPSAKLSTAVAGFRSKGTVEAWAQAMSLLNRPGLEAHAFTVMLAFGAPLLKFLKHAGVMFSMLGETNGGKTSAARYMMSVYGEYSELALNWNSTYNAKMDRIGMYANLPVYLDEASDVDAKQIANLAYEFTIGQGKERLRQDGTARPTLPWNTFIVTSTNRSLQGKIETTKGVNRGQSIRCFEYRVPSDDDNVPTLRAIHEVVHTNFGVAGERYLQALVAKGEQALTAELRGIEEQLVAAAKCPGEERFWVAGIACALYGGSLAGALGIFPVDIARVIQWVLGQIKDARGAIEGTKPDPISILAGYLNETTQSRLVVGRGSGLEGAGNQIAVIKHPQHGMHQRLELANKQIFISRKHIKTWLEENGHDYTRVKKELIKADVLVDADKPKNLGAHTPYTGAQVECWRVLLRGPRLDEWTKDEATEEV